MVRDLKTGVVARYFLDRGFGFIDIDGGGELFFHRTNFGDQGRKETPQVKQRVAFRIGNGGLEGRLQALRVVALYGPEVDGWVESYDPQNREGRIALSDGGVVYFRTSALDDDIKPNDPDFVDSRVGLNVQKTSKGLRAVNIWPIE